MAGTVAAQFRQGGYEYPIVVRLREEDRELVTDVNDVMVSTASGMALPVKNVMTIQSQLGPSQIDRKNQERMVLVSAEPEIPLSEAVEAVTGGCPRSTVRRTSPSASAPRSNSRQRRSTSCAWC